MAILGEYDNPIPTKSIFGKLVSYLILITPLSAFIIVALWNPFGKNDNNKARYRSSYLLRDKGSSGRFPVFE
jgi:hypothetical protein